MGVSIKEPFVRRAIRFVRETQLEDGSWEGRWGSELYLRHVARPARPEGDRRGHEPGLGFARGQLARFVPERDGGWGETCATYDNPSSRGRAKARRRKSAWALMGIIAASDHIRPSILRGVEYLAGTQNPDGSWTEDHITGTGFPKVFYLKYDMYRNNWPLLALADFRALAAKDRR